MRLRKGGIVFATLRWLGYSEGKLMYGGVSLCQTFWSIVLGVPLVALYRFARPYFVWAYRLLEDPNDLTFKILGRVLVRGLLLPAAVVAVSLTLLHGGVQQFFFVLAIISAIMLSLVMLIGALIAGVNTVMPQLDAHPEFAAVIAERYRAAKDKVCPTIKFE